MEGTEIIKTPVLFFGNTSVSDLPKKLTAIWLRWPVVIICSYLLVYSGGEWLSFTAIYSFLLIYVLSNAALYFIGERLFGSSYFYTTLFSFDTLFLTACLVITGKMGTDFYLAYFLIIIVASICQNFRGLIVVALLAPLLYGFILFRTTETFDPSIYLRLPFLFVISLFYGYFAELLRIDMGERDEASKQIRQYQGRQDALYDINLAVTSALDLPAIQDVLLEKIYLLLPCIAASSLTLFNKGSGGVETLACRSTDGDQWKARIKQRCGSLTEVVVETKSPLVVSHLQTDARIENREFFRGLGLVSYLGVPLIVKNQVLGVLSLFTKEQHQFNGEEAKFLTALASNAAIAIHSSQLSEQTKRQSVELERASKVREEFLSVMSHELRTPLNVVLGYAGMMKDGVLGQINSEQTKALDKVISRARDQIDLINSILQATQMETGTVKVESHEFNLNDFLDYVRSHYEFPLGKELTLNWDFPANLPVVKTDSEKLKYVLENLINNAIKFTKEGSVTISARCLSAAKTVQFGVADTGIGISRELLPTIFDRFRQLDSSETRLHGGVGLGLYIVKGFTELLGGKVEVKSELGKGSIFTVTIPFETSEETGVNSAIHQSAPRVA